MASVPGIGGGQVLDLQSFYSRNASLGTTQRVRDATLAQLYYLSKQYESKRDWNDKSVPLRERKPRIIVPLFRETVEAVDRFLWSGHRFPKAVVNATRDADEAMDSDEIGPVLIPEQAEQLTTFLAALIRSGKIAQAVREYTTEALKTTSAAVVVCIQSGFLNCYVHTGKDCTPTFDPKNPREVIELEIKYQYPREEQSLSGGLVKRWYWYRRVISTTRDVVFQEVQAIAGRDPVWIEDAEKTVQHDLGFCPVRWIRTFGDCSDPIDGKPLIDPALYPLLDAVSFVVSQRQRAVEYGLDPQPFRKGVPQGEREDLKKNPGQVWDLPEVADVGFLEAKGSGAETASKHLDDLKTAFREAVGVVKANPEINAGSVSGVALEMLHAPLIALASDLRVDLGDDAFVSLLGLALRLVTTVVQDKGQDVWVPGVRKATAILKSAQLAGVWLDPPITLDWPAFFNETEQDRLQRVQYTNQAVQGGLVSAKTGTRQVAEIFAIEDAAAERDSIDEEKTASMGSELASLLPPSKPPQVQPGKPAPTEPDEDDTSKR
jgi:Phage portal protein, SPP1 Gp6-like